jgi:hypothetical protein
MMKIKLAILLMMLAGQGHAEQKSLLPDDVPVIKEALLHFVRQTNFFNYASTNAPVLVLELWSRSRGKLVQGETNRTDLLIVETSLSSKAFTLWVGGEKTVYENGYGEEGKTATIQSSTLASLLSRHETDVSALATNSAIFKMVKDSPFLSDRLFADTYPDAKAYVNIWLPGFNAKNDEALFGFHFGPRHHPSLAVYKLRRAEAKWRVTWFSLCYY